MSFPQRRESSIEKALEERQIGQHLPQHFVSSLQDYQGLDSRLRGNDSVVSSYEPQQETRMQSMKESNSKPDANLLPKDFTKPVYTPSAQRETVTINRSELNCMVKSLELPNVEDLTPELKEVVLKPH